MAAGAKVPRTRFTERRAGIQKLEHVRKFVFRVLQDGHSGSQGLFGGQFLERNHENGLEQCVAAIDDHRGSSDIAGGVAGEVNG